MSFCTDRLDRTFHLLLHSLEDGDRGNDMCALCNGN